MSPAPVSPIALVAIVALVAGCGTSRGEVAVETPTPTIFSEDELTDPGSADPTIVTTSTTTTTLPLAQRLPLLDDDGIARVVITPTEIVVPVVAATGSGWIVTTPCGNEVEIVVGRPVSAAHVVIDAGHGGPSEPGAIGATGLRESDLNLAVAELVAQQLRDLGVEVVLTRTTDTRSTLATRASIATSLRARAFVSIHHNSDPDGPASGPGSEVWYQIDDAESRRLSGLIYEEVVAALSPYEIDWVADTDAGVKFRLNQRGTDYYGILRNAVGVPSALAELAFLSNPPEEELLATTDGQAAEATAVAAGIVRFLASDDAGSGFVEPYERVEPAGPGGGAAGCVDPPLQ